MQQDSEDNEEVQYWKDLDDIEDDPVDLTISMITRTNNLSAKPHKRNISRCEYYQSRTTYPTS